MAIDADPRITAALVTSGIAFVVSLANSFLSFLRYRREQRIENKAEEAIKIILSGDKLFVAFSILKFHLRGLPENDLRQRLIGCGAICFNDINGVECWSLVRRIRLDMENGCELVEVPVVKIPAKYISGD